MHIYISPQNDEQHVEDLQRMEDHPGILPMVLSFGQRLTVQDVVHRLSHVQCKGLLVPDDYHRHNELIEHVKACAYHMGQPVGTLTLHLKNPPPPPSAQVHASAEGGGVRRGIPAPAG